MPTLAGKKISSTSSLSARAVSISRSTMFRIIRQRWLYKSLLPRRHSVYSPKKVYTINKEIINLFIVKKSTIKAKYVALKKSALEPERDEKDKHLLPS